MRQEANQVRGNEECQGIKQMPFYTASKGRANDCIVIDIFLFQ
jgi:hypothetical protein